MIRLSTVSSKLKVRNNGRFSSIRLVLIIPLRVRVAPRAPTCREGQTETFLAGAIAAMNLLLFLGVSVCPVKFVEEAAGVA